LGNLAGDNVCCKILLLEGSLLSLLLTAFQRVGSLSEGPPARLHIGETRARVYAVHPTKQPGIEVAAFPWLAIKGEQAIELEVELSRR